MGIFQKTGYVKARDVVVEMLMWDLWGVNRVHTVHEHSYDINISEVIMFKILFLIKRW